MAKPTDDFDAVRIVVEALQDFDTEDQDRILRWAREKLRLVESPAPPLPTPVKPMPSPAASDRPAPPLATSAPRKLEIVERPAVEAPKVEPPVIERPVFERPVVERPVVSVPQVQSPEVRQVAANYLEVEEDEAAQVEPAEAQPEAVNLLMPPPEEKSRAFLVIGIILMAVAVGFLILMIMSHGK